MKVTRQIIWLTCMIGSSSLPLAGGEVARRSNPVADGGIVLDGDFADWVNVQSFPADAAGDGADGQDWVRAWLAHDADYLYLRFQRPAGSAGFASLGYWALFDTDNNSTTGLTGFGPRYFSIGAELNTSGLGTLNRWSSGGCYTGSAALAYALSPDATQVETAFRRSELGPVIQFRVLFVGENSGDYYPDDGASGAFFTYSLLPCNDPFADADGDGHVDGDDLAFWRACMSGPADPAGDFDFQSCGCFDRDLDQDVDMDDFGRFQVCLSGPGVVADVSCDDPPPAPPRSLIERFVELPSEVRPFPEPLPPGGAPGFRIRGAKGWNWNPAQYLAEVPTLAAGRMNFLMNCYLSLYTAVGGNYWWQPLPESTKEAYAQVIVACRAHGIEFCFSMNPQLFSPDPLDPTSASDFELLWQHYDWAQRQGVRWFSLALDDVSGIPIVGEEHAILVNRLVNRLRIRDPQAEVIFCPTWYWGTGSDPTHRAYLQALAANMDPNVYVFWTGDAVVATRITRAAAEQFQSTVGHRLILWDNYPVNDGAPTLHLGPVTGREPGLSQVLDGYMSNPLYPQNEANRIPLLTIADFAYNPYAYDPLRSIGQVIVRLADGPEQRLVLKDLVEAYPGIFIQECAGFSTGYNPVRQRYLRVTGDPSLAAAYIDSIASISLRLAAYFPTSFADARAIVEADVEWMRQDQTGRSSK